MNLYAWSIDFGNRRGEYVRTESGVILAATQQAAEEAVWQELGSDYSYHLNVYAIPQADLNAGKIIIL